MRNILLFGCISLFWIGLEGRAQSVAPYATSVIGTIPSINNSVRPDNDTLRPITDTARPVQDTIKPTTDTIRPATDTTRPVQDTVKSISDTVKSISDTLKPGQDTTRPIPDTVKPAPDTARSLKDSVKALQDTVLSLENSIKALNDSIKTLRVTAKSLSDTIRSVPDMVKSPSWKLATVPDKDMGDVLHSFLGPHHHMDSPSGEIKDTRVHFTLLPAGGYTLQTGSAAIISGNAAFYADVSANTKMSSISSSVTYSQYHQWIVPFQSNIWTKKNRFNFITDLRYIKYPSSVYGLGGRTDPNKGYTINFEGFKFHQTVMKSLSEDLYIGVGYFYDKFSGIKAIDKISQQINSQMTKELGKHEVASGLAWRFSYDSRLNQINPKQGAYYNITYRNSNKAWGSDSTWNSLQIDARNYLQFPKGSRNVLAFWMLDWMTTNGVPPYLLLPSTGWDDQYNTGRGYIQGRFRGKNMLYFESEYRFAISRNGLIGGVAFVNIQNFSSDLSKQYAQIFPGYGGGIRIKLNKFSDTNLCLDYGFGQNGSRGFFVNLGEVF